ncbi:uncharacterized protein LOC141858647 [Brevipalpus obovatus]|uniref:uncharacterized protein LOC141858647 n=1 Tax=Brevipalpus obovatus TaxID=246614 RepID=UPI003D9F859B
MPKVVKKIQRCHPFDKPGSSSILSPSVVSLFSPCSNVSGSMFGSLMKVDEQIANIKKKIVPVYDWRNLWTMELSDKLRVTVDYSFDKKDSKKPPKCVLQVRNWYPNPNSPDKMMVPSSYGVTLRQEDILFLIELFNQDSIDHGKVYSNDSLKVVPYSDRIFLGSIGKDGGIRFSLESLAIILQILPVWMEILSIVKGEDSEKKRKVLDKIKMGILAVELSKIDDIKNLVEGIQKEKDPQKMTQKYLELLREKGLLEEDKLEFYRDKWSKAFDILNLEMNMLDGEGMLIWQDAFIQVFEQYFLSIGGDMGENASYLVISHYLNTSSDRLTMGSAFSGVNTGRNKNLSTDIKEKIRHTDKSLEETRAYYELVVKTINVLNENLNDINRTLEEENKSLHHVRTENQNLREIINQLNQQIETDIIDMEFLESRLSQTEWETIEKTQEIGVLRIQNSWIHEDLHEQKDKIKRVKQKIKHGIESYVDETFHLISEAEKKIMKDQLMESIFN